MKLLNIKARRIAKKVKDKLSLIVNAQCQYKHLHKIYQIYISKYYITTDHISCTKYQSWPQHKIKADKLKVVHRCLLILNFTQNFAVFISYVENSEQFALKN